VQEGGEPSCRSARDPVWGTGNPRIPSFLPAAVGGKTGHSGKPKSPDYEIAKACALRVQNAKIVPMRVGYSSSLISRHKAGVQGAKPPAGVWGVPSQLLSPLCSPPKEASYDWMSVAAD